MVATLRVSHTAVGAEVRRGRYDIYVDGTQVGSVEVDQTADIPVAPGSHRLQIRSGRDSSPAKTFDVADGQVASFRATGKSFLPIFLLSFLVRSLALRLVEDHRGAHA